MSTYDYSHLIKLWSLGSITSEQAIGQILLHVQALRDRVQILERVVPQQELEQRTNELFDEEETAEFDTGFDTDFDQKGVDAISPTE